jgi:hypothetical protein
VQRLSVVVTDVSRRTYWAATPQRRATAHVAPVDGTCNTATTRAHAARPMACGLYPFYVMSVSSCKRSQTLPSHSEMLVSRKWRVIQ